MPLLQDSQSWGAVGHLAWALSKHPEDDLSARAANQTRVTVPLAEEPTRHSLWLCGAGGPDVSRVLGGGGGSWLLAV